MKMYLFWLETQIKGSKYFNSGVEKGVRFLEDDDDDDENDDDFVFVRTYSQKWMPIRIQANWPLGCFLEQLLKN